MDVVRYGTNAPKYRRRPVAAVLPEPVWEDRRRYSVVVDAGSSGSRLMVYSWRDVAWDRANRLQRGMPLDVLPSIEKGVAPTQDTPWQIKVEPGLSSYAGRLGELRAYWEHLFEHVRRVVPPSALSSTPVHILATAGMRLLPPMDRQAVLLETCRLLREQPFMAPATADDFTGADADQACAGQVRVISGEEEGLLGWLAVNYLMHGFQGGSSTVGFLDMGGASTQIAFEPLDGGESESEMFNVTLRRFDATEDEHKVFVTTFLGYGTNAARTRYLYALTGGADAAPTVSSVPNTVPDPCLPKNLRLPLDDGLGEVLGTGSFEQCLAQQEPLLDREAACTLSPCLFHGVHVPPIDFSQHAFVGVSEYWYSSHDVFHLGGAYDHARFHEAAKAFCASEWPTIESQWTAHQYPDQVTLSRLHMQCFKAAWVSTVLHEGLQLPRGHNHSIFQSVNDVRGLGVSWTLGQALLEASKDVAAQTPLASPSLVSVSATWALWGLASVVLVVLLVLYRDRLVPRRGGRWRLVPTHDALDLARQPSPGARTPETSVLFDADALPKSRPSSAPRSAPLMRDDTTPRLSRSAMLPVTSPGLSGRTSPHPLALSTDSALSLGEKRRGSAGPLRALSPQHPWAPAPDDVALARRGSSPGDSSVKTTAMALASGSTLSSRPPSRVSSPHLQEPLRLTNIPLGSLPPSRVASPRPPESRRIPTPGFGPSPLLRPQRPTEGRLRLSPSPSPHLASSIIDDEGVPMSPTAPL